MKKRGEPQLEPATVNWAAAFNALGDAVFLLDGEGTVQQCNEALSRLLNLPRDQVLGRKCYELLHGSSKYLPNCPFLRSRQTRQRATQELALGDRFFLINVDPIFDSGGAFQGAVLTLSDITERRQAEKSLRQANFYNRSLIEASLDPLVTRLELLKRS